MRHRVSPETVTPVRYGKALAIAFSIVVLTVGHFAVSRGTHPDHIVHVIFQALYLLPVIGGAIWYGSRGGVTASGGVAVAYSLHLAHWWPGEPLETPNQIALIVMFVFVGAIAGMLVDRQEAERHATVERERRAQRAAIVQAIAGLSTALGLRDEYTRQHSERVAALAVQIGRVRGLDREHLERLRLAALIHDVGKIGIPDDILSKPDELTAKERATIERHPTLAAEILFPIDGTQDIAAVVLSHHECPDGSGYPRGATADQIPIEAAILRVADVFGALTDRRAYKPAMEPQRALLWMLTMSGRKFDGPSLEALRDVLAAEGSGESAEPPHPK